MRAPMLKLAKYYASANSALQNKLAYRADLFGTGLTYSIFVFIFVNLWKSVFSQSAVISGYTKNMGIWYFIVAEIAAFGSSGIFKTITEEVKNGAVAYALGRPYSYLGYQFSQNLGETLPSQFILIILGSLFGFFYAGALPLGGILHLPAVLFSLSLSVCLSFFIQAAISLSAFWLEENSAFYWIYMKLILIVGTLMPVEFLPERFHLAARLSPFSSVAYAPARLAVAFEGRQALSILGVQLFWTIAAGLLASMIYRRGVKHVSVQGG